MNTVALRRIVKTVRKGLIKQSPKILTALGIVSGVAAVGFAIADTPKAMRLIDEAKEEKEKACEEPKLTKKEVVKKTWKCYRKTAAMVVLFVCFIVGGQFQSLKRLAVATAACQASETALLEFKQAAEEVLEDDQLFRVKQKAAEKKVEHLSSSNDILEDSAVENGEVWFIDPYSNHKFKSTVNKIEKAVNMVNYRMRNECTMTLSDYYDELNLDHTALSDFVGWTIEDGYVDACLSTAIVKDGIPYVVADFLKGPTHAALDKYSY